MQTLALSPSEPRATAPRSQKPGRLSTGSVRSQAAALGAAALVGAGVIATAGQAPLPAFGWAAAFVFLAVERDVRERRIPNWLTFPAFGLALVHGALGGGAAGLATALLGAVCALAILVLPYSRGWFGAGDVKAVMVLGALWGPGVLVPVLTWAMLWGGVVALAWLAVRGGLPDLLARWWGSLVLTLANRRLTRLPPVPGSVAAGGIPFAVTLGLAIGTYQLWGSPWA